MHTCVHSAARPTCSTPNRYFSTLDSVMLDDPMRAIAEESNPDAAMTRMEGTQSAPNSMWTTDGVSWRCAQHACSNQSQACMLDTLAQSDCHQCCLGSAECPAFWSSWDYGWTRLVQLSVCRNGLVLWSIVQADPAPAQSLADAKWSFNVGCAAAVRTHQQCPPIMCAYTILPSTWSNRQLP